MTDPNLSRGALALLAAYASYANRSSGIAWPGDEQLARDTGMRRESVQRARERLANAGYLRLLGRRARRVQIQLIEGAGKCDAAASQENPGKCDAAASQDHVTQLHHSRSLQGSIPPVVPQRDAATGAGKRHRPWRADRSSSEGAPHGAQAARQGPRQDRTRCAACGNPAHGQINLTTHCGAEPCTRFARRNPTHGGYVIEPLIETGEAHHERPSETD